LLLCWLSLGALDIFACKMQRAACGEFPNDNFELHDGAVWVQDEPAGGLSIEVRAAVSTPLIEEEEEPIEVVEELPAIEDAVVETIPPPPPAGPYDNLLQLLCEMAFLAGGSEASGKVLLELTTSPIAEAWRLILNGESEDFGACGPLPLDEWAAGIVARATGGRSDAVRRELRSRGVAAFGMAA
jgi:hypothetical protein